MGQAREAILSDTFPAYLLSFFPRYFASSPEGIPRWCVDALKSVGVDLEPVIAKRDDLKVKEPESVAESGQ
jgi:hypothetical protein